MALAVSTKKPAVPVLWLQVGAGLAVVSALIFILVGRSKSETSPQQSRVVSVAKKSATPGSKQSSAPKVAAHVPAKRTVLVPGTGRVKARVVPDKDLKDYSHLLGSGEWGTAQATLRLMNRPGNGQVIGVVPKGEVVTIQRVKGEWALVSYLSAKKKFAGWTLRNLVE